MWSSFRTPQFLGGDLELNDLEDLRDVPTEPRPAVTMPGSYENITDEEELHKMMNATEDFAERKAIRARLREIRDKQREEMEAKRKEREARAEDHVKKKFLQAEEQKRKTMEAYKQVGPTHERDSKYHTFTENMIQEKQKQADADKAAKMAAYSSTKTTVGPGGETITTSIVTERTPVGTVSKKVVEKTGPGSSPAGAGRPAEETARELTEQLMRASGPGVRGQITVKTESWNSADGKVEKSEKTQTWGAKPQGAKGAMAAFKQMDNAANPAPARPNGLLAVSLAKKAATTMRRNAVAIKQEILYFCKMNTQEYEEVEITNFSTSWNNGMAFCALIHHFYPHAFDFKSLDPKQRRKNFELAFDTAEKEGDIAPLLDVEDMVRMKTPDWKCVFTYVQSLYRHLKDHENNKAVSVEQ
ncbi:hypothetical protein RRG08_019145 [Elysia crispata]|uniref:Calponin-homology (CH) domain-containing protein n=1 Tax=Elysia crispata TaxID=231223 RepID=A0AAE1BDH6_9GAST|nr:hypothetical protein RRG08_019145 [Elysia crispata]